MSMSFNEFQREIQKRISDPQQAYILTLMYERFSDLAQQQETLASLMITLSNTIERVVKMHQSDQETVSQLAKRAGMLGKEPGVDVNSVANDPEDM